MATTYEPIATTTLGSAAADVTFSSIVGTYTDLVLVVNGGIVNSSQDLSLRFNSDSGTNYSDTSLQGFAGGATSSRQSNTNKMYLDEAGAPTTLVGTYIINVFNYSNSTTYKTVISRFSNGGSTASALVGLWRSTSAITSIIVAATSGNLLSGSTFTLYGIKAA